jgi:hypothetical protein
MLIGFKCGDLRLCEGNPQQGFDFTGKIFHRFLIIPLSRVDREVLWNFMLTVILITEKSLWEQT